MKNTVYSVVLTTSDNETLFVDEDYKLQKEKIKIFENRNDAEKILEECVHGIDYIEYGNIVEIEKSIIEELEKGLDKSL